MCASQVPADILNETVLMEVAMPLEFALVLSILFALLGAWVVHLSNRMNSTEKEITELRRLVLRLYVVLEEHGGSD